MDKIGTIFDIKRYAIHDGPGIRTTVFFKGCPLKCRWCHNPEGISQEPEIVFQPAKCIRGCSICVGVCPKGAVSKPEESRITIDRELCAVCGACAGACPGEAIQKIGRIVGVQEVMKEIEKDRAFHEESEGGVTFSGGEPMFQPDFLLALLRECKERGIHTAVDTSGYATEEVAGAVAQEAGLILYDIKNYDEASHVEFTGGSNKLILENLKRLSRMKCPISIRIPVVPGMNDSEEEIRLVSEFLLSLGSIREIALLPFHRGGRNKYRKLGLEDAMEGVDSPSEDQMQMLKSKYERYGFTVRIGG